MKHLVPIMVILLMVSTSFVGVSYNFEKSSTIAYDGNILYVGGSGPGNYTKIQDAIDNASDGDTVFVYSYWYFENVIINKSISLTGEEGDMPSIIGDPAITLLGDGAIVNGFEITSHLGHNSIFLSYSEGNKIYSNIILDCISFVYSNNNKVYDNVLLQGQNGMHLQKSNNNYLCYNSILEHREQSEPYGCGIILEDSDFSDISYNNFSDNDVGIWCINSNENEINRNIFSNYHGSISLEQSDKNNILENIFFSGNNIHLYNSYKNSINYNNIYNGANAYFTYTSFPFLFANNWNNNYWGKSLFHPKIIFGSIGIIGLIPWINFDWHPAKEPYPIGV